MGKEFECQKCHTKESEYFLEPCFGRYTTLCIRCSDELRSNKIYRLSQKIHHGFDKTMFFLWFVGDALYHDFKDMFMKLIAWIRK